MTDLSTQPQAPVARRKLLLVEDDASVQASLRLFLEPDYEVHSASTVRGGVDLFMRLNPSLVVLDLRLPDGDGLEALRRIRQVSPTAPVIVLTGYASMSSVEESLRLGASDFLHKPFNGFALKSRIDSLTSPHPSRREPLNKVLQSLANTVPGLTELELQANAAAMFLHDAASPVMAALSAAHIVSEAMETQPERFDDETREAGALLQRAMGFVSGLFEQSRFLENWDGLEMSEVAIGKIVVLAVELAHSKAVQRKVSVSVHMPNPETKVCVNQFALARVLLNLLRNAIEAVEPGCGRVVVSIDAVGNHVEFSVQDNGPGLDPRLMDQVFDAHFTTKPEGMGLGLYICKHLVERMGGTLAVHNVPGLGCRFSVGIPHAL